MVSDREQLACLVQQWNENRLDLFHLSYPTEDLEVEGVMRFYFQDGGEKVVTKCVRVSSTATTRAVVDALSEKFLPDLKMLSNDTYSLWEVHENGDERQLDEEEKPLLVQLMWHKDDREGRFLLKREREGAIAPLGAINLQDIDKKNGRFAKKKEKEPRKKHQKDFIQVNLGREEATHSEDIYKQVPFNTFTRTISNPEAVMKKRREKKLETKLKEMTYGGSLKVYGGDIVPSRPYVTILAGLQEKADKILIEALEKYGLDSTSDEFILVEVIPTNEESRKSMSDLRDIDGRTIAPNECPLMQMAARSGENKIESFLAIKRKQPDYQVPSTSIPTKNTITFPKSPNLKNLPKLTIINPDGKLSTHHIILNEGLTEVGSDREMANFSPHNIYLNGMEIRGRHAAIANIEDAVTLTPSTKDAYLEINGVSIMQTEILNDGDIIRIGVDNVFLFSSQKTSDSKASTTRCVPSDYCSLPMNGGNDYYPASVSGSSISSSRQGNEEMNLANNNVLPVFSKNEPINVPISIQIGDYNVWDFLGEVMSNRSGSSNDGTMSFRLAPTYALYLALKFFHTHNKPYSMQFFSRIESNLKHLALESSSKDDLIFWLANASEFYHLIERDVSLKGARCGKLTIEIERIFRRLVCVFQSLIRPASRSLLDIHLNDQDATVDIINLLDSTLRTARTCRLNPAFTIQLCGHLLHSINAFVFNNLVAVGFQPIPLTTRLGKCLQYRLETIHRFCERMGVELAAECHLDRSKQAANLLAASKNDVATLGSTCYKLNSLQVIHLLSSFEAQEGEHLCEDDVIDRIVRLAEKQADHLTVTDGQRVTLEESDELNLPFLIPQDDYFIDQMKGVPEGLWQYLLQLQNRRLCHSVKMTTSDQNGTNGWVQNQNSSNNMTSSMSISSKLIPSQPIVRSVSQTTLTSIPTTKFGESFGSSTAATSNEMYPPNPEHLIRVVLHKGQNGIGLSIVAAQGVGDQKLGIYVKKVVEGSAAAKDGRLEAGDQLLAVNGHSLIGILQEDAAKLMINSGNDVHFDVFKRAAYRNGLNTWLMNNSPTTPSTVTAYHQFDGFTSHPPQPQPPPPSYDNPPNIDSRISYDAPPPSYNQRFSNQVLGKKDTDRNGSLHLQQHYQHHNMNQEYQAMSEHYRSSSASDLQNNDPNASFSHSSITSSARNSVFDKLPSHYRHSARPTVIQPGRPNSGAQSPSNLRRNAQSPSSNLYRPTSASNLFAPPRQFSTSALAGYSSKAARESTQDIHRALNELDVSSPLARSTPKEEDYRPNGNCSIYSSSKFIGSSQNNRPSSMYGTNNLTNQQSPSAVYSPSHNSSSLKQTNIFNNLVRKTEMSPRNNAISRSQEPVVVRPDDLNMPTISVANSSQIGHQKPKGAVPTAITQALQLQQQQTRSGTGLVRTIRPSSELRDRLLQDADVRQLEKTNIALMSYEAVNEELDQLDMKGQNMTEEETRRYRELLNVAAEQSRARKLLTDNRSPILPSKKPSERDIPIVVQKTSGSLNGRQETVIDDVPNSRSSIENVSPMTPPESRKVQFIDEISHNPATTTLFAADVPLLDSPGIVGTNEIYLDPRQRRLNEIQDRKKENIGSDGAKLGFRDKQRLFARQIGEEGTPRQRVDASSAQRQIESEILINTNTSLQQQP